MIWFRLCYFTHQIKQEVMYIAVFIYVSGTFSLLNEFNDILGLT